MESLKASIIRAKKKEDERKLLPIRNHKLVVSLANNLKNKDLLQQVLLASSSGVEPVKTNNISLLKKYVEQTKILEEKYK